MKIIKRIILFLFMFLSLAGCEGGCGEVGFSYVKIENHSDQSIDVGVFWANSGHYQVVPPHGTAVYNVTDSLYTAKAKPVSDWLSFATQKRDELVKDLKLEESQQNYAITPEQRQRQAEISANLNQINAQIKSFRDQINTYKTCQGLIIPDLPDTTSVFVNNGEAAHSITITCQSNQASEN